MSIYKLYGTSDGDTDNAIASVDIVADGRIVAVSIDYRCDLDEDNGFCEVELSFGSTNTLQNNDTRLACEECARPRAPRTCVGRAAVPGRIMHAAERTCRRAPPATGRPELRLRAWLAGGHRGDVPPRHVSVTHCRV